ITAEPNLAPGRLWLRTGAWYGDRAMAVPIPPSWNVDVHTLSTRKPLTDAQIMARLEAPVGQPTIRELCRGKARPVVIVDDLNRPTPASRIMPTLLRQFQDAGIPPQNVGIVMASGTHGSPPVDAFAKKVGAQAAKLCQLHVHNCNGNLVNRGKTSFGTPILVNKHVVDSDFLVGIGGLYPNHSAGFGGGSKLALGVLGFRSIARLHWGHDSAGWGAPNGLSSFRRELDEIAQVIGLNTTVSLLLNADREVVEVACGSHRAYYADLLGSAKEAYHAPLPEDRADVVISNAYPADLSLTFAQMKAFHMLAASPRRASRIAIASCSEGLGFHALFPYMNAPKYHRQRMMAMHGRMLLGQPDVLAQKVFRLLTRKLGFRRGESGPTTRNPIWLYRPGGAETDHLPTLPAQIPGIRVTSSWDEIVEAVSREQGDRNALRVMAYSCASMQWIG
ncbi:MAG: lactate racemase domain-containing protein, partial [Actinomycetota bacterium]|nr:lactate racemase domain-containing protein [Actinomycetota bacterium]